MTRHKTLQDCPICGSQNLEHLLGEHRSSLRGTAHNVPQTVCHDCGEVFLDAESLKVIRQSEQHGGHEYPTMNMVYWKTSHYELFILKSMLQRLAYRSLENKEVLHKTIGQVEELENGIRERRQTAKQEERDIPQQDFRKRIRIISETAHNVSDFVSNGFFSLKSEIQRTLRHLSTNSPFYQQLTEIVERVEQSEEALNDLKSLHEGVIIRPKLFTIKDIFKTWNGVKTFQQATIQLDIRNGDEQFYGDEQKIRSFVNELIENAVKHNPDQSDLQITIRSYTEKNPFIPHQTIPDDRRYLVINICDNGKGIPAEKKAWIFIALNSTAEQGSGLGLFIIQRTLHRMGGHITETGTDCANFTMYIPYQDGEQ